MLKPLTPANAERLRQFLSEASYTYEEFRQTPMLRELPSPRSGNLPLLLERTRDPTLQNVVLRTFFMGIPLDGKLFGDLIPPPEQAFMLESGMLVRHGDLLTPAVMLTPVEEYVFVSDPVARIQSEESADIVLWPNPTTLLLQQFAVRRPFQATLDLGAGCGIQAVLAAGHSQCVTATDLNPRAGDFVTFNARLNGVRNIEYLQGDTFEPVKDRAFDLILANPPFFVTPSSGELYCENSMDLDQYCRRVVREAPRHLIEGGLLQMVFEWVQVRGQPWQERLSEWVEGAGCDAWILRGYARDAASYAQERISHTSAGQTAAAAAKFEQWMAYYRSHGVKEVHGGILAMRRRSGTNWTRIEEMPVNPSEPFGDSVLETFANQDALQAHNTDEQLLLLKPRLAPDAQLERRFHLEDRKWKTASMKLLLATGVPPAPLAVEPQVAEFISRCDGSHTLGELAQELAAKVNAGPDQVRSQCCAVIRKLAERRFVLI